jgi:hypothetical protein
VSKGAHHVVQPLAHENNFGALCLQVLQAGHAIGLQVRLQFVLEVFVAEKVKAIAGNPTQNAVHHPGSEYTVHGIQKRTQRCHQEHKAAASHTRRKGLGVPSKKGYRLYRGEIEKTALDSPVDRGGRTGVPGIWFQRLQELQ